jgi:hypothetical protein
VNEGIAAIICNSDRREIFSSIQSLRIRILDRIYLIFALGTE